MLLKITAYENFFSGGMDIFWDNNNNKLSTQTEITNFWSSFQIATYNYSLDSCVNNSEWLVISANTLSTSMRTEFSRQDKKVNSFPLLSTLFAATKGARMYLLG